MALTQQEFLTVAGLNPNTFNVWYDDSSEEILGVTVPLQDISIPSQNALQYLLEIETITFPISTGTEVVTMNVGDKALLGTPPNQYYFLKADPTTPLTIVPSINPVLSLPNSVVNFSPTVVGSFFINGDYNATLNNIQEIRSSTIIENAGTTTLANVQDSLYLDTGWIQGRYEGSKTQAQDFSNISPTLTGKEFQGTYYPVNVADNLIRSQSGAERISTQYLHTGPEALPEYTIEQIGWTLGEIISDGEAEEIRVEKGVTATVDIVVGDLLRIYTAGTPGEEVLKVSRVYESLGQLNIDVIRRWNQTPTTSSYAGGSIIGRIKPTQIFKLEGNRVDTVNIGKIFVRDVEDILYVDPLGSIISGSRI